MKLYEWHDRGFHVISHNTSAEYARQVALQEIDRSRLTEWEQVRPVCEVAREIVQSKLPDLWRGPRAQLIITDRGNLEEMELVLRTLREGKDDDIEALRRERDYLKAKLAQVGAGKLVF